MRSTAHPAETRIVRHNVSWAEFEALLADDDRPMRGRLAYEEGMLEIMSPSSEHEELKSVIGRLVEAYAQVLDIDVRVAGSTTLKREMKRRGAEPDESYYVQNEPLVRSIKDLELGRDPPPDIVIEIQITRSSLNKLGIYGAMGVPEVWLWEQGTLKVYWLDESGKYEEHDRSRALPGLPLAELLRFAGMTREKSTTRLANEFREWVRRNIREATGGP